MIYMTHPTHGAMHVYLDSEVEANKKNGWAVTELEVIPEPIPEETPASSLTDEEKLFAQYEAKFGKQPHHRMKIESIREALED